MRRDSPSICILACKRLIHNTRVVRQAIALHDAGWRVTVVSLERPIESLRQLAPGVDFLRVQVRPWPADVIIACVVVDALIRKCLGMVKSIIGSSGRSGHGAIGKLAERGIFAPAARRVFGARVHVARARQFGRRALRRTGGNNFELCMAHDSFALRAAKALARRDGARLVYDAVEAPHERSGRSIGGSSGVVRTPERDIETDIIRHADLVLSVGPSLAGWTSEQYAIQDPVVIRNCSLYRDRPLGSPLRDDLGLASGVTIGVVLGSLYEGQGLARLARALTLCDRDIHLAALGPETQAGYADELRAKLEELDLSRRFHILPAVGQDQVIDYVSGADFGVIALLQDRLNHRVALPNKIFEYVMARLPVASGNIPDIAQLIRSHDIGEIFDDNSNADIADCLQRISRPERLAALRPRLDVAARELCWEREAESLMEAFERLRRRP